MTGFIRPYRGAQLRCTCDRDSCEGCATFKTFFGRITNADRIRALTDEELAEWINKHDCHTKKDAILDWLKQEAENGYNDN